MPDYKNIVEHYEQCFARYGDNYQGVDWPNLADLHKRFKVMLAVAHGKSAFSLLDFGCGNGLLLEYLLTSPEFSSIQYTGLDLSASFVKVCQEKFPQYRFLCGDVLQDPKIIDTYDFIIMNGVLTERCELSQAEMWSYTQRLLKNLFAKCRVGLAFNAMTKCVDWEREELFHLPFDQLAQFLKENLSNHFQIRQDYGLYEYTTYVYRQAIL